MMRKDGASHTACLPYPICDPCCAGPHSDCQPDYQHFLLLAESESESDDAGLRCPCDSPCPYPDQPTPPPPVTWGRIAAWYAAQPPAEPRRPRWRRSLVSRRSDARAQARLDAAAGLPCQPPAGMTAAARADYRRAYHRAL